MKSISLDITKAAQFLSEGAVKAYEPQVKAAQEALENGTCPGNDFLGWLHLPSSITPEFIAELQSVANTLREKCEVVVVAGIGGSYLGARAVIEALGNSFAWLVQDKKNPTVVFAGNNIGEDYLAELTTYLKNKKFGVINISKSGTTTETALTFRLLKKQCEDQRGKEEAKDVIVAITDAHKGAARAAATKEGYKTFVIPDNVGGRFSVLTPVGLLPIAVAGFDITALVNGAADMEKATGKDVPFDENPAAIYAAVRNALYAEAGKKIEILVNYQPKLHFMSEWWKQLYGESEGKDQKGIFPAACDFTTDLHSMGQWIQEGERSIFETVISVETPNEKLLFPHDDENLDGLNFLEGKRVDEVNKMAELGTRLAHVDGGVPNILVNVPELNAYYLGQLIYFFEKACGISGLLEEVNPFNQPGVEAYKKNMFALLNKPGYEAESKAIQERLANEKKLMKEIISKYLKDHGFGEFNPKAVLFDMDGVLYNSMPNHAVAWQESMKQFDIHMTAADAYATEGARGIDTIQMMVKKQKGIDITLDEAQKMYDVKTDIFHSMPTAEIFPGVKEIMQKIKEAGMQVGVVTGSGQRPLILRLLNDFGEYLDEAHIVTAYDVKRGKPNPDPYLMGLQKAGNLQPWEGIVVENAPLGVRAGVAANIFTVAINSGPLPDTELSDKGSNLLYHQMTEFCDDFGSLIDAAKETGNNAEGNRKNG